MLQSAFQSILKIGLAGPLLVSGKQILLKVGCDNADAAIAALHQTWNGIVQAIDVPFISEEAERKVEDEIWGRIEAGLLAFKAKVCAPEPPEPEALAALANDATLPESIA